MDSVNLILVLQTVYYLFSIILIIVRLLKEKKIIKQNKQQINYF